MFANVGSAHYTSDCFVHNFSQLVEDSPLGVGVRDVVVLHPAPAGVEVEVVARVGAGVHVGQQGCSWNGSLPKTMDWCLTI